MAAAVHGDLRPQMGTGSGVPVLMDVGTGTEVPVPVFVPGFRAGRLSAPPRGRSVAGFVEPAG
jgi:hypothetical protein